MKRWTRGAGLSLMCLAGTPVHADIRISEIVVDPQYDWNGDGAITPSDEWFEIFNTGIEAVDLTGITLRLIDTTPNGRSLTDFGYLEPNQRIVLLNPEGAQNNDGRVELFDVFNQSVIDGFSYGNWEGNNLGIPNGNAHGMYDESLSRFPEGTDAFYKTWSTYNSGNVPAPSTGLVGLLAIRVISNRKHR